MDLVDGLWPSYRNRRFVCRLGRKGLTRGRPWLGFCSSYRLVLSVVQELVIAIAAGFHLVESLVVCLLALCPCCCCCGASCFARVLHLFASRVLTGRTLPPGC